MFHWQRPLLLAPGVALAAAVALGAAPPASACGWWGDAEAVAARASAGAEAPSPAATAFQAAAAVPGGGYALAVFGTGAVLPFGDVADGEDVAADPAGLGFEVVADLTPSPEEAADHRRRIGATMRHVHLGTEAEVPSPEAVAAFAALVAEAEARPVLVYAQQAETLGTMWALRLIADGTARDEAIQAARGLGLDAAAEGALWWHLRNGLLKDAF